MASRPRLKSVVVHYLDGQVVIWPRALQRMFIDDPSGHLAALLRILADGNIEAGQLPAELARRGHPVTADDITSVLGSLDELGVLMEADGDAILAPATRERHQSNLRYYDLFARLGQASASFHQSVERSRVLLLGAGGLGAGILQSLVGLGVGEVTLVDFDTVEAANLARQFVYGTDAIGRPKVLAARDWARTYSPGTLVRPVHRRVTDAAAIADLARAATGQAAADVVVCAIDSPDNIHLLVNEACCELGIPFVAGGLTYSTLSYWSVQPGQSPCRLCLELHREDERQAMPAVLREPPLIEPSPVNRATGPVVQLICGLMGLEVMRYLTRTDPPVAAAAYQVIELADHLEASQAPWARHPACPLCAAAARRAAGPGTDDTALLAAAAAAGASR
jgi:molybdopterin/thiamine biosynthesis adenylyltransferase